MNVRINLDQINDFQIAIVHMHPKTDGLLTKFDQDTIGHLQEACLKINPCLFQFVTWESQKAWSINELRKLIK